MANRWMCFSSDERKTITDVLGDNPHFKSIVKKLNAVDKKIKVSSAKGKGRNLQQFVCERISTILSIPFVNKDDFCDIHSREMGQSGVDVVLRGEALKKFPFSIECKSAENISLRSFIVSGILFVLITKSQSVPSFVFALA